jgi:hypothetical protein
VFAKCPLIIDRLPSAKQTADICKPLCRKNAKEQASPFRLRIQVRDLIRRQDLDFWLPGSKSDCAGNTDGFALDHSKSLVSRYRGPGPQ